MLDPFTHSLMVCMIYYMILNLQIIFGWEGGTFKLHTFEKDVNMLHYDNIFTYGF